MFILCKYALRSYTGDEGVVVYLICMCLFVSVCACIQHQQVICQGLGIADFMLEPVQRIPRYKLLLEGK